jgi:alpha-D-ribose 1-methylphosphonate 5-triphosphate diphosphatase
MAYDAQIAAAGITTVFDSFRVGIDEYEDWRSGVGEQVLTLADAIERARVADLLRADHQTHLRCEIPSLNVVDSLAAFLARHPARLVSLMDHTPGQRQFRDLDKYFIYYQLDFAHFRAPVSDGGPKDGRFRDDAHGLFDR